MNADTRNVIVVAPGPNLLIRFLWFVFVGWWVGGIVNLIAAVCMITIVGIPLGLWLVNRLPAVMTLRPATGQFTLSEDGVLTHTGAHQRPFWLRALYFIFVGWWFSAVWMLGAYLLCVTLIGLPFGFWAYGRIGAVTTLYRV